MNNNINKSNMMDLTISVIKSIKNAVIENKIEISYNNFVMWDVCKKEYKFFINENVPFYYTMPNGEQCGNFNPSFNLEHLMSTSDEDLVGELDRFCELYSPEINSTLDYYNYLVNGEQD